jgi:metal-dependent amidase/aminoacylase/carboxypeptidase family protein
MFHGIIPHGGAAPNIVPEFAEAYFYVRAANKSTLEDAVRKVVECAHGACKMTGASLRIVYETGYDDMRTNTALSKTFNKNLKLFGEKDIKGPGAGLGSIDMGNVSHSIPSIHPWVGFGDSGLVLHSAEFARRTVTDEAKELIVRVACAMAATGYDVIVSEALQKAIDDEFRGL